MQLKVTAIFENRSSAENALEYLLGNGFTDGGSLEQEDSHAEVAHNTALIAGDSLSVYSETSREAQEALDVLNNYGAVKVNIIENS